MKYCSNKDINKLIQELVRNNWVFKNGSKHGRLYSPDGTYNITVSKSPSDYRYYQIFIRYVRRFKSRQSIPVTATCE